MKRKLINSLRLLLVAAGLCTGASAWAEDITITYDFQAYANEKCPKFRDQVELTLGSSVGNVYSSTKNYLVNDLPDFSFGGNIAFQTTDFRFRNSDSKGALDRRGIFSNGNDRYLSIVDLAVGDKVTLTFPDAGGILFVSTNATYDNAGEATAVTQWGAVVSEKEYTITTAGRLDLQQKGKSNSYMTLLKIQIVTSRTETVSSPTIAATGANGVERTITITPGASSIKSGITTYYTTDGSTPTTSSTKYTTPFTIDETKTIKAITVSNSSAATSSEVASQNIEAGTAIELVAPTINISSMVPNGGLYSPQFTIANSENSGLIGSPSPTLSATFNGEDIDISSGTYTPNGRGTLVVTASAEGYTSKSTEQSVYGVYNCLATPNFNEIALADLATTIGGTWETESATRWSSWSTTGGINADLTSNGGANYYPAKLTDGGSVTIGDWFKVNRNRGSSTLRALAGYGLGDQSYAATFDILTPEEGAIVEYAIGRNTPTVIYYTMTAADGALASKNFSFGTAAYVIKYCKYYTVATVSKDITAAGWATYCSPYALDLENATNLTDAYIVTGGAGGVLTKTSVKGGTVPANTGLLLKGTEGTVTIPVVASSSTDVSANKLVGVTANTEIAAEAGYVLMNDATNGLAFYKNKNAFTVGANTAYLPANFAGGGARFDSFSFDDETTGITQIENGKSNIENSVYNLNGQRVSKPKNGLYIVNGKKVIVK